MKSFARMILVASLVREGEIKLQRTQRTQRKENGDEANDDGGGVRGYDTSKLVWMWQ